jgi:chromosome segregation ATPase
LSYSGGGSGKSFGSRGSASKKEKKKKQEFHRHHLKFTPEEHQSLDQLKDRTSLGLQKLGSQVFSSDPGGYGFQNWMTSFNLLLDDFEEKCKPATLPGEYHELRQRLSNVLLEPVLTSDLDLEIKNLEGEISIVGEKIAEVVESSEKVAVDEWHEDEAKIGRLKRERTQVDLDVEDAKEKLEEEKKKRNQSMYRRLFTNSDALKPLQAKVDALLSKRQEIEQDLRSLEQDRQNKHEKVKKLEIDISNHRTNLEELRSKLGEAEARKLEALQIVERRSEVTKSMSEMISSLRLVSPTETEQENDLL